MYPYISIYENGQEYFDIWTSLERTYTSTGSIFAQYFQKVDKD